MMDSKYEELSGSGTDDAESHTPKENCNIRTTSVKDNRTQRNILERKRKEKIKMYISQLKDMIPSDYMPSMKKPTSSNGVLEQAVAYMRHLKHQAELFLVNNGPEAQRLEIERLRAELVVVTNERDKYEKMAQQAAAVTPRMLAKVSGKDSTSDIQPPNQLRPLETNTDQSSISAIPGKGLVIMMDGSGEAFFANEHGIPIAQVATPQQLLTDNAMAKSMVLSAACGITTVPQFSTAASTINDQLTNCNIVASTSNGLVTLSGSTGQLPGAIILPYPQTFPGLTSNPTSGLNIISTATSINSSSYGLASSVITSTSCSVVSSIPSSAEVTYSASSTAPSIMFIGGQPAVMNSASTTQPIDNIMNQFGRKIMPKPSVLAQIPHGMITLSPIPLPIPSIGIAPSYISDHTTNKKKKTTRKKVVKEAAEKTPADDILATATASLFSPAKEKESAMGPPVHQSSTGQTNDSSDMMATHEQPFHIPTLPLNGVRARRTKKRKIKETKAQKDTENNQKCTKKSKSVRANIVREVAKSPNASVFEDVLTAPADREGDATDSVTAVTDQSQAIEFDQNDLDNILDQVENIDGSKKSSDNITQPLVSKPGEYQLLEGDEEIGHVFTSSNGAKVTAVTTDNPLSDNPSISSYTTSESYLIGNLTKTTEQPVDHRQKSQQKVPLVNSTSVVHDSYAISAAYQAYTPRLASCDSSKTSQSQPEANTNHLAASGLRQHSQPEANTNPLSTSSMQQHSEANTSHPAVTGIQQHSQPDANTNPLSTSSMQQHSEANTSHPAVTGIQQHSQPEANTNHLSTSIIQQHSQSKANTNHLSSSAMQQRSQPEANTNHLAASGVWQHSQSRVNTNHPPASSIWQQFHSKANTSHLAVSGVGQQSQQQSKMLASWDTKGSVGTSDYFNKPDTTEKIVSFSPLGSIESSISTKPLQTDHKDHQSLQNIPLSEQNYNERRPESNNQQLHTGMTEHIQSRTSSNTSANNQPLSVDNPTSTPKSSTTAAWSPAKEAEWMTRSLQTQANYSTPNPLSSQSYFRSFQDSLSKEYSSASTNHQLTEMPKSYPAPQPFQDTPYQYTQFSAFTNAMNTPPSSRVDEKTAARANQSYSQPVFASFTGNSDVHPPNQPADQPIWERSPQGSDARRALYDKHQSSHLGNDRTADTRMSHMANTSTLAKPNKSLEEANVKANYSSQQSEFRSRKKSQAKIMPSAASRSMRTSSQSDNAAYSHTPVSSAYDTTQRSSKPFHPVSRQHSNDHTATSKSQMFSTESLLNIGDNARSSTTSASQHPSQSSYPLSTSFGASNNALLLDKDKSFMASQAKSTPFNVNLFTTSTQSLSSLQPPMTSSLGFSSLGDTSFTFSLTSASQPPPLSSTASHSSHANFASSAQLPFFLPATSHHITLQDTNPGSRFDDSTVSTERSNPNAVSQPGHHHNSYPDNFNPRLTNSFRDKPNSCMPNTIVPPQSPAMKTKRAKSQQAEPTKEFSSNLAYNIPPHPYGMPQFARSSETPSNFFSAPSMYNKPTGPLGMPFQHPGFPTIPSRSAHSFTPHQPPMNPAPRFNINSFFKENTPIEAAFKLSGNTSHGSMYAQQSPHLYHNPMSINNILGSAPGFDANRTAPSVAAAFTGSHTGFTGFHHPFDFNMSGQS